MNLVFDFGAVLFTWQPAQLLLQTFPRQVASPEAARQLAHQVFGHPDWHAFDCGLLEPDTVIERIAQRLDLPLALVRQLVHGIGVRLVPMPDTLALLQQLRARRLAGQGVTGLYYLSNMPVLYARALEAGHDFLQWFDGGIFSGDVKLIKPDPAIYRLLQSRYALEPACTLFVDDLKGNVQQARLLGWQGIQFESARQLQTELALSGLL
ncbi:MAG: HAD family hydrolase [Rhodoferax sp.]